MLHVAFRLPNRHPKEKATLNNASRRYILLTINYRKAIVTVSPAQKVYLQHHQDYHLRRVFWWPFAGTDATRGSWVFARHELRPPHEPAALKSVVPDIVHPIQDGITPKLLLLPHSDSELLSYIDDDSSARDGYITWVMSAATATRERHMACISSVFQPKYRFDNSVPNRLLERTRIPAFEVGR